MGLSRRSIKHKLTLVSMCTTTVALLLACVLFLAYDYVTFRDQEIAALSTLGTTIGAASTAALSFDDPATAQESLETLAPHANVTAARIYTAEGTAFAQYQRQGVPVFEQPALLAVGSYVTWSHLEVVEPIALAGDHIGSIVLRASRDAQYARMRRFAGIAAAIILTSWIAAFVLTSWLQQVISGPVLRLAHAAALVSRDRDYSVRVVRTTNDELGDLVTGFNQMLEQIQHQDKQLRRHHATLEKDVATRTAALTAANRDLALSRDRAEQANRAKSEFLANVSHEIRTPMNGVIGMIDLTLDSALGDDQREQLQVVKTSAESLLLVVNDILDLSKIEAGRLELDETSFALRDVVQEAVRTAGVGARLKELVVTCEVDDSVSAVVTGDAGRLRQVLINLVGNAVKFTEQGGISVRVWLEAGPDRRAVVRGSVADTGIGIPEDKQALIFEAFAQADGSTTRRFGGTGLGLTISARLLSLMGGHLRVESVEGQGSTFHFDLQVSLPATPGRVATPAASPAPAGPLPEHTQALSVLLVEDNIVNQRVARGVLKKAGHAVQVANNGREALDILASTSFDLILMDMQMPVMGGLEAIAAIRAEEAVTGLHVPIIAVTAHALEGDREQFLAAGADGYVSKPIALARVVAEIDGVLQAIGAAPAPALPRA